VIQHRSKVKKSFIHIGHGWHPTGFINIPSNASRLTCKSLNVSSAKKQKATDFKNQWLSNWWAHLDSNLGPKDYEQLQEIKPIANQ
jgi:hypothetical protein